MGWYPDRGGWNHLEIEQDEDGLVMFSIVKRKSRESIRLNANDWNLREMQKDLLVAFGRNVPSAMDNSLGADFSSAQEDRFGAALTRAGVTYRRSPTTRLRRRGDGNWVFCYPDFVIEKNAWVAVFFDGCYFHGCNDCCPINSRAQAERDVKINEGLRRNGWEVIRIWEHEDFDEAAHRVAAAVAQRTAANTRRLR